MTMTLSGTSGLTFPDTSTQEKSAANGQTGSAPFYSARAWVNFNGTGTVAIRASGNVSSITDNGTGDYTVNFTNAMPDEKYAVNVTGYGASGAGGDGSVTSTTSGDVRIWMHSMSGSGGVDLSIVCVSIFR